MQDNARSAFRRELALARRAEERGDFVSARRHLERGHILGQQSLLTHMMSHYRMYQLARRMSDMKEVRGQVVRMIGAGPFHLIGWVPIGNTGGADVSPTLPMALPADIQPYFESFSLRKGLITRGVLLAVFVFALTLI